MNREKFEQTVKNAGLELNDHQLNQLEQYKNLLQEWNQKMNLTALDQDEQIWEKHFADSLVPFIAFPFKTLMDVGTGAGFPGMVLAIVWPEREITLVEPTGKRCTFLEHVKKSLGLKNVTILNERAEELDKKLKNSFDIVTARAVSRLSMLMELCIPFVKTGGLFIALKGRNAKIELEEAEPALKALNVKLKAEEVFHLNDEIDRINLIFEKTGDCDDMYPRMWSLIKKKPLEKKKNV